MKYTSLPRWGLFLIAAATLMGSLAMSGSRPQSAKALVGAYVELHVAECPPGYLVNSLFEDCHENRVAGVTLMAEGAGGERYEVVTDANGVAFFNDFYTAGRLTITEKTPDSSSVGIAMYCRTTEDEIVLPVNESDSSRAASFDLPQAVIDSGTGVVCDWYFFPPVSAPNHHLCRD